MLTNDIISFEQLGQGFCRLLIKTFDMAEYIRKSKGLYQHKYAG